ncbi:MAG: response regulator receiver protein [Verrucomicrobia bacterium]|nr:response regulator receiver protein [Verrucomicrobiota bacterium]
MHIAHIITPPLIPSSQRATVYVTVVPVDTLKMALANADHPPPPILLVESCAADLYLTSRRLEADGVTNPIISAREISEAMILLQEVIRDPRRHPLPIVMFTDLKFLWADGLDLIKWVKRQPGLDQMRVIVLTGSADPGKMAEAKALGADRYLAKFPEPGVFATIVADATPEMGTPAA